MGFKVDASKVFSGLSNLSYRMDDAFRMYAETSAKKLEGYTKQNRPWTDRTNRARLGLTSYVKPIEKGYRIVLAHTVDYGLWLELAMEKRFAILEPTVRLKGPEVLEGMKKLMDRLGD